MSYVCFRSFISFLVLLILFICILIVGMDQFILVFFHVLFRYVREFLLLIFHWFSLNLIIFKVDDPFLGFRFIILSKWTFQNNNLVHIHLTFNNISYITLHYTTLHYIT